jgi:small subunit ribosomal protein S2
MRDKHLLDRLVQQKAHLGSASVASNMFQYIQGYRGKTPFINLQETLFLLQRALAFLKTLHDAKGQILLVNSEPKYTTLVQFLSHKLEQPYVNEAWIGGLLTNWEQMKTSVGAFHKFDSFFEPFLQQQQTPFPKYLKTKKKLKGIKNMHQRPAALFFFPTLNNEHIVREAKILNIPVVALVETATPNGNIEYPVPFNTQSMKSVYLFCQLWWSTVQKKQKLE